MSISIAQSQSQIKHLTLKISQSYFLWPSNLPIKLIKQSLVLWPFMTYLYSMKLMYNVRNKRVSGQIFPFKTSPALNDHTADNYTKNHPIHTRLGLVKCYKEVNLYMFCQSLLSLASNRIVIRSEINGSNKIPYCFLAIEVPNVDYTTVTSVVRSG